MLVFLLFAFYSLLVVLWSQLALANFFLQPVKKSLLTNMILVSLFSIPILAYFFALGYTLLSFYILVIAILSILVASISAVYQDFILLHGPVMLLFYLSFLFHLYPQSFDQLPYNAPLLLFVYTALLLLYLYRTEKKTGTVGFDRGLLPWKIYASMFLLGGSVVFLLSELVGIFKEPVALAIGAKGSSFFFFWAALVLVSEVFSKIGWYKTIHNCLQLPASVRIVSTMVFQALFFALFFPVCRFFGSASASAWRARSSMHGGIFSFLCCFIRCFLC